MSIEHQVFVGLGIFGASGIVAIGIMMTQRFQDKERTLQRLRVALVNDMHNDMCKGMHIRDGRGIKGFIQECCVRALFRAYRRGI